MRQLGPAGRCCLPPPRHDSAGGRAHARPTAVRLAKRLPGIAAYRAFVALTLLLASGSSLAQQLTPRAYWPAPTGTSLLVVAYAHQTGDVVTDPSLPLIGVESDIQIGVLAWQETLDLFGRTTNLQLELPRTLGSTRGEVDGLPARRDLDGWGDFAMELSVNLSGAPAMSVEDFQAFRQQPRPILAASIKVVAPTGQYDADRLINIGSNRWAVRARLGYSYPIRRKWVLETAIGTWFFTDNDEFLGATREQEPITALDLSLIRRFRPGFWASIDANYYIGGRTIIDDKRSADFQRNSRLGFSLAWPFAARHALKLSYVNGIATEAGGDFDSLGVTYIYRLR